MDENMAISDAFLISNNYAFIYIEGLWLIPIYFFFLLLLPRIKSKLLIRSEGASLSKLNTDNTLFYHPLIKSSLSHNKKNNFNLLSITIISIIFTLISIALSHPVRISEELRKTVPQRDITFIVDTSVSMILRDYILDDNRIDRMSLLKEVLDRFIKKFKNDRMSIIVFGNSAYTLVPFTTDQYLLSKMLSRIQATMAGRFNAIGEGITLAVKQASLSNEDKNNILILLTDSDQPTGKISPKTAANYAKKQNIPIYTIGIGAAHHSAEEKVQGGLIYSPVNMLLLDTISKITKAKSYHATDIKELEEAIYTINLHEQSTASTKTVYRYEPLYVDILSIALIVFLIWQFSVFINSIFINKTINRE